MNSREKILSAVIANQPELVSLPDLSFLETNTPGSLDQFTTVLKAVGGFVHHVNSYNEVINNLLAANGENKKIISAVTQLAAYYNEEYFTNPQIVDMQDIDVAIFKGRF